MSAPIYSTARTFRGFGYQKTLVVPKTTSEASHIIIIAPCNDVSGGVVQQSGPLSSATAVSCTQIIDPMVTDLLTALTTTSATNPLGSRFTEMCVEVTSTEALASTANLMYFTRWTQGQLPLASAINGATALGPEFLSMWNSALASEPSPASMGELVKTHCYHASMCDRDALEFPKYVTGTATWRNVYDPNIGGTYSGTLWDPIVILIRGSTIPEYTLTVRGKLDFQPALNSAWYRVSSLPPAPSPAQEAQWWKHQRALASSPLKPVYSEKSRAIAGYVGAGSKGDAPVKTKALRGSKGKVPAERPLTKAEKAAQIQLAAVGGTIAGLGAAAARAPFRLALRAAAQRRRRNELRR